MLSWHHKEETAGVHVNFGHFALAIVCKPCWDFCSPPYFHHFTWQTQKCEHIASMACLSGRSQGVHILFGTPGASVLPVGSWSKGKPHSLLTYGDQQLVHHWSQHQFQKYPGATSLAIPTITCWNQCDSDFPLFCLSFQPMPPGGFKIANERVISIEQSPFPVSRLFSGFGIPLEACNSQMSPKPHQVKKPSFPSFKMWFFSPLHWNVLIFSGNMAKY